MQSRDTEKSKKLKSALSLRTTSSPATEVVNHPAHYQGPNRIECIDAIEAALGGYEFQAYLKGNILKYIFRMNKKGRPLEDAKKANWYSTKLVKVMEKEVHGEK